MKKIAVNGLGRTGRAIVRRQFLSPTDPPFNEVQVVAGNDLASIDDMAYLLTYDSVHGKLAEPVTVDGDDLCHRDCRLRYVQQSSTARLPWRELEVDVVIECTGKHTRREDAMGHVSEGAKRVLIGAPSPDADFTLVMGVNQHDFNPGAHHIVSNASCTTNAIVPPLHVLWDAFGIERVNVTTVHAYTASQSVVDQAAAKKHRGRAAAMSIIPTTTGADVATVQVLPRLRGRIVANAMRVPIVDGSIADITAVLQRPATAEDVNTALRDASNGALTEILAFSDDELVSVDILGEPYSGIVHGRSTQTSGPLVNVQVWYDNEIGYASRCLDAVAQRGF